MLCALVALSAACDRGIHDGFGVAVTATFDSSVADSDLLRVTALRYDASGDETYTSTEQLGRTVDRVERFLYRPKSTTHEVLVELFALDANGAVVAEGRSELLKLDTTDTTPASITLYPPDESDLGVPSDLSGDADVVGGNISFVTTPVVPTCTGPVDLVVADFSGDTRPDVAVACKQAGKVQVFFTNPDGSFPSTPSWETSAATTPVALATGDFGHDGIPDLVVLDLNQGSLLFSGVAGGKFTMGSFVAITPGLDSMTVADLDGDMTPDLAFGSSLKPGVWVLYGNAPQTPSMRTTAASVTCIHAADVVGDSRLDLLTCEPSANLIEILPNQSGVLGMPSSYTSLTADGVVQALVFDWNDDGKNDIYAFTPTATGGNVTAFANSSTGFTPTVLYGPDDLDVDSHAIVTHFDDDKHFDIVGVGNDSQQMVVALGKNNTPPDYSKGASFYTSEGGLGALAAGTFGGNTQISIAAVNQTSSTLALARGNANGVTAARAFADAIHPRIYDFNLDHNNDIAIIAVPNKFGAGAVLDLVDGDGLGNFVGHGTVAFGPATQSAFADMNGDMVPDVMMSGSDGSVCVALASKAGTFGPCTISMEGTTFIDVATADFDGDGNKDVVLLDDSETANNTQRNVVVVYGNGKGGFTTTVKYPAFNPVAFVVANITGSLTGHKGSDIVALSSSGGLSVLVDGASGLMMPTTIPTSVSNATSLAVLDANHDGHLDLAVSGDTTHVLFGNGDGTFTDAGEVYSMPSAGVTAGDVDGDGYDDLIVMTDHSIVVLPGAVAHAGPPLEFAAGAELKEVLAGNLTKDSLVDVITTGQRASLLVNNTIPN
jgi:hypothetical protein